jgi:LysM repeat protein
MMRQISVILLISSSFFMVSAYSATASVLPADSLKVKWMNGQKFILHKVEAGETYSKLSRRYNCPIDVMMQANNGVELLKVDQIIHIPILDAGVSPSAGIQNSQQQNSQTIPNSASAKAKQVPVYHTVKPGETLFALARKYDQPVETIKSMNQLTSDGIQTGQKLIVKFVTEAGGQVLAQTETQKVVIPPAPPAQEKATASTGTTATDIISPAVETAGTPADAAVQTKNDRNTAADQYFDKPTKTVTPVKKNSGKSMIQIAETGVATLFADGAAQNNKYYGLHRTAPIGTIVKVTNRMNNQSVYVKIVGVLPDTGENDNIIIKMSSAVSDKLNALDKYFQVELSYGMME